MAIPIIRPEDGPDPLGSGGFGRVPTLGGNPATSVPGPGGTPSQTQDQQSTTSASQASAQAIVLPPLPYAVFQRLDPSGALTIWGQSIYRKLGGYTATPLDDVFASEDVGASVDLYARTMLADLQDMPGSDAALIADLYRRLDELTQLVLMIQPQGWNRQPAQAAATASAPAGGTGTAAGGWDTSEHRNTAIAYLNNVGARVASLEASLKAAQIIF